MGTANSPTHYGFFSTSAAALSGVCIYQTPDGREVQVTCVTTDPEGSGYWWDDKVCVGEVTKMVGEIKAPSLSKGKSWPW